MRTNGKDPTMPGKAPTNDIALNDQHPDDLYSMGFNGLYGVTSPLVNMYLEQGHDFIAQLFDIHKGDPEHTKLCKALLPAYVTACATIFAARAKPFTTAGMPEGDAQ
jgi:hypothetical protein